MIDGLRNLARIAANEQSSARVGTRIGIITGYDPAIFAVKVKLQPDDTLTGWIPLKSAWVGNGWGMFCAPVLGTAVQVEFQESDGGVGGASLSFFNDEDAPLPVPSGEFWLVHKTGTSLKLTADGAATIDTGKGASFQLKDGNIKSAGNWQHSGKITASDDVLAGSISLKTHKTTGVQPGSGLSGGPQ